MPTPEELEGLLRDVESDRVERTRSTKDTDKFSQAVCAFANDLPGRRQPGYLFVGANPDGSASGAAITDSLLTALGGLRSDGNIQPLPVINVSKQQLGGGEIAVVEVHPADQPPVRHRGVVWVRVGPRKATASEHEERILSEKRTHFAKTWDAQPARGTSLSDLSLDLFRLSYLPQAVAPEVLAENHRDIIHQLESLRFYDSRAGCPTNAALLLFAQDVLGAVPGAYVQYVHYDGVSQAADIRRERRLHGDLLTVLRGMDELCLELAEERPIPIRPGHPQEQIVYDYPPKALHELFVNAVIHRNYDGSTTPVFINRFADRVEVTNPGGLYGEVTIERFPRPGAYRNPVLTEAAKTLGFCNRFTRGIELAQSLLAKNDSPRAQFEFAPNSFSVTVLRRPG